MISPFLMVPSIGLAALVPALLAIYLISALKPSSLRYLAAAGVGLAFWFFFDTMGNAASLEENNALYPPYLFNGLPHLALLGAFALGIFVLAFLDRIAVPAGQAGGGTSPLPKGALFLIPAAAAFVMGVHSLGEGWDAVAPVSSGVVASTGLFEALIQAFGTFPAVVSFPIHKFLEASIVGILYTAYVSGGRGAQRKWWHIPMLGLLFAGPSFIGAAAGYYFTFDTTYFFAFGVTAALYVVLRLVEPISPSFMLGTGGPSRFGFRVFFALGVGFLLLYTAALLH